MDKKVKNRTTRISSKHQITIPKLAMEQAGLEPGDRLTARAQGSGMLVLERVTDPLEELAGALDRNLIEGLREEWA
ncbi:MAG: AbrB/MazE/SpoVT family DNA-binding domain-containing protein [Acidimicrobiia bacterium]